MKPTIITIAGRKGGVGKTTLTLALAAHWARNGESVVIIDADHQSSATLTLGADFAGATTAAALESRSVPEPVPLETWPLVSLMASGPEMETVRPEKLKATLSKLKARYVIADLPPGKPDLDRAFLAASHVVLVALEPHFMALAGAARLLAEVDGLSSKVAAVMGRVDNRRRIDAALGRELKAGLECPLFIVRQDSQLSAALHSFTFPPVSQATEDVAKIADWITQ
jgi:chromosome partitioning protein